MKKLFLSALLACTCAAQADTLRIGVESAYPPFSFKTESGDLSGFDIDFARALCDEIKAQCELVETSWDGLIPSLNSGKIDAIVLRWPRPMSADRMLISVINITTAAAASLSWKKRRPRS